MKIKIKTRTSYTQWQSKSVENFRLRLCQKLSIQIRNQIQPILA